jgi:hypothetical protein
LGTRLGQCGTDVRRRTKEVGSRPHLSNKQNKNEFASTNIVKGFWVNDFKDKSAQDVVKHWNKSY